MADGRWQMADGRWQMADGRWHFALMSAFAGFFCELVLFSCIASFARTSCLLYEHVELHEYIELQEYVELYDHVEDCDSALNFHYPTPSGGSLKAQLNCLIS
jgi:hypothetical protein